MSELVDTLLLQDAIDQDVQASDPVRAMLHAAADEVDALRAELVRERRSAADLADAWASTQRLLRKAREASNG